MFCKLIYASVIVRVILILQECTFFSCHLKAVLAFLTIRNLEGPYEMKILKENF